MGLEQVVAIVFFWSTAVYLLIDEPKVQNIARIVAGVSAVLYGLLILL